MNSNTIGESDLTVNQLYELCHMCQRNEAGKHFTEFCSDLETLVDHGYIIIDMPIDHVTGLDLDPLNSMVSLTPLGLEIIDEYSEYIQEA